MSVQDLPHTIMTDIDGCVFYHWGDIEKILASPTVVLDGVKEKFQEWNLKDYYIILTTGRRESLRQFTEQQLRDAGIQYDLLIMGLRRGPRVVINDCKPNSTEPTAQAINLERNKGMKGLEI